MPFAGYLLPVQYPAGVIHEHMAVRERAGLFDVSHMGEVLFEQTYLSEYETVPVTLEGSGSAMVSIYVNGTLVEERIVVYD